MIVARALVPATAGLVIGLIGTLWLSPTLQTLLFDPSLGGRYEVTNVITTVDAVHIASQLSAFPEASRQIAFANVVAITKSDLIDASRVAIAREDVRRLNPAARIVIRVSA